MNFPNFYPQYINKISNPVEEVEWKKKYLDAYRQDYNVVNSEWYGLKAAMYGVSLLAITIFAAIMNAAKLDKGAFQIASTITVLAIGTTAAICTMIFYGCKAEENYKLLHNFGQIFAIRYEIFFDEEMIRKNHKRQQEDEKVEESI